MLGHWIWLVGWKSEASLLAHGDFESSGLCRDRNGGILESELLHKDSDV